MDKVTAVVPGVEEIQRLVKEALKGLMPGQVPAFAKSVVEAPVKGWCKTEYYDALTGSRFSFYEPPTVVAVAFVREGPSRMITAPTISIPTVEMPTVPSIKIPTVEAPEAPEITIPTVEVPSVPGITVPAIKLPAASVIPKISIKLPTIPAIKVPEPKIDATPLWNLHGYRYVCGWAVQWACDMLNPPMELWDKVIEVLATSINIINDGFTKTKQAIKEAEDALTTFRDNLDSAINGVDGLTEKVKVSVDVGLADLKGKTETVLNTFRGTVESSVTGAMRDYSGKVQTAFNSYQENIKVSVDAGLADGKAKTEETLGKFRASVEASVTAAMKDHRDKTQAAFNTYRDNVQRSVNAGLTQFIPVFYDMMGLPPPEVDPEQAEQLHEMGDVNRDGVIDQKDLDLIEAAYGSREGDPDWNPECDLDHDGVITSYDMTRASGNYGKTAVSTAQLLSPAQLRNVTSGGFEFYGLSAGMKLSYVAVGRR